MTGTYCSTCGCQTIRWAGCVDEWHEQLFDGTLGSDIASDPRAVAWPGVWHRNLIGGPPHE